MNAPRDSDGRSTFLSTVRTVAWGFLGLRKRSGHDNDMSRVRPAHVIVAGLLGGLIFVLLLVLAVSLVTS
ncbi:DUF2970 domain-containing protein [Castellaniella sp. S9]|uniref:DUF2970 domain-containing protein n=1 Tax=Castellaniella sp. S9 TaxID=2993652 RepID=UPI0022B52B8A|nr:DUF2970 domain-containing protein [Castellaniella sp. S9]